MSSARFWGVSLAFSLVLAGTSMLPAGCGSEVDNDGEGGGGGAMACPSDPVGVWTVSYEDVPGTEGCFAFEANKILEITESAEGTLLVLFGRSSNSYDSNGGLMSHLTIDTESAEISADGCELTVTRSVTDYYGETQTSDETLELTFSGDDATGQVTYSLGGFACGGSGTTSATARRTSR